MFLRHPIMFNSSQVSKHRYHGSTQAMFACRISGDYPFVRNRSFFLLLRSVFQGGLTEKKSGGGDDT